MTEESRTLDITRVTDIEEVKYIGHRTSFPRGFNLREKFDDDVVVVPFWFDSNEKEDMDRLDGDARACEMNVHTYDAYPGFLFTSRPISLG